MIDEALEPDESNEDLPGEELPAEEEEPAGEEEAPPALVTTDTRLSFSAADELGRRRGLRVVLLAGEIEVGKTTVLVALWEQLLQSGVVGPAGFAGSWSAMGFERRAWLSRVRSSPHRPDTERTFLETSGWLHLRLAANKDLHELLLSDLTGELFERIRKGEPAEQVLPELHRVDRVLVVVDGAAVADNARRQTALASSRRIADQLHVSDALPDSVRVAVVLAKVDCVDAAARERWEAVSDDLLTRARSIDANAVVLELAARPEDGSDPAGLEQLAAFLLEEDAPVAPTPPELPRAARTIGRLG